MCVHCFFFLFVVLYYACHGFRIYIFCCVTIVYDKFYTIVIIINTVHLLDEIQIFGTRRLNRTAPLTPPTTTETALRLFAPHPVIRQYHHTSIVAISRSSFRNHHAHSKHSCLDHICDCRISDEQYERARSVARVGQLLFFDADGIRASESSRRT